MNVDTGEFRALTAQLARLTKQVTKLTEWKIHTDAFFEVGRMRAAEDARAELLGKAAERSRAPRPRPGYLRAVDGGQR